MKKVIIFSGLLILLSSAGALAQDERKGTITATLGFGIGFSTTVETATQLSVILDLNFISRTGFTLGLDNTWSYRGGAAGPTQNIMLGAGYTFIRDDWNIGGMFTISPTAFDLLLGGKIKGGYYFTDDIGVTGIIMYRRIAGIFSDHLSMFDVFIGPSIRF